MTHPVHAAITRARGMFPPDRLAERVVTDLHAVADAGDPRAREVVVRLEQLAAQPGGDARPADAFRAGVIVAEHLGLDDYEATAWARRYGRALITARMVLAAHTPDGDTDLAWSADTEAAVAQALALTSTRVRVDPYRRETPRG